MRLTVSQATSLIKQVLNQCLPELLVEGEISGLSRPASGHWYFNLKDAQSVLPCVIYAQNRPDFVPRDGDRVMALGMADYFARFGKGQLTVRLLQPIGEGELLRRKEELRRKLQSEGLFEPGRKPPLPELPARIGVVTSATGAVIRDIIKVVETRFPLMTIYVAPCRVQGIEAPEEIVAAIQLLNRHGQAEVLIVGRGGGSVEDLWAFNDERVVRAVAASRIPVISAVGHEVDHVLCDLAATSRAATPSQAAELVTPRALPEWRQVLTARLIRMQERVQTLMRQRRAGVERLQVQVDHLHPRRRLEAAQARHGDLAARLTAAMRAILKRRREAVLERRVPQQTFRVWDYRTRTERLEARLSAALRLYMEGRRRHTGALERQIQILSPRAIQQRGYAIVLRGPRIVRDAAEVRPGEWLEILLAEGRGRIRVQVGPEETEGITGDS